MVLGASEFHFALLVAYIFASINVPDAEKSALNANFSTGIIVHSVTWIGLSYDRGDLKYHRRAFYRYFGLFESLSWFVILLKYIKELSLAGETFNAVYCIYLTDVFVTLSMIVSSMYATFLVHINSNSFIQTEFEIYASRTYNELEKVDYLEANFYALIELAKNICPFLVTYNFILTETVFPEPGFPEELLKIAYLQIASLLGFLVFFFVQVRLGKGKWNQTKKWLFIMALFVSKLVVPVLILVVAWSPLFSSDSACQPYFIVIVVFELLKPLALVNQLNYFRHLPMTDVNKRVYNWQRWKQVIFGIDAPKDFNKREQLQRLKNIAWTTKQKHLELENYITPLSTKTTGKLQLDESINSLLYVSCLNLDGERLDHLPSSFTDKNEKGETRQQFAYIKYTYYAYIAWTSQVTLLAIIFPEFYQNFVNPPLAALESSTTSEEANNLIAKLILAILLHIQLVPQAMQGITMMKFALNHPHRFHNWTSGFLNGFMTLIIPIGIEIATAFLLAPMAEPVLYDLTEYIYLASIAIIPSVFAFPLKQDPLYKLLIAKNKPVALTIDRTSSNVNMWHGETYLDCKFGGNFAGLDIPSEVQEAWHDAW